MSLSIKKKGIEKNIIEQADLVKKRGMYSGGKSALIIGGSSSYGLAARTSLTYGANADTINVSFERGPSEDSEGTVGYWNNHYFQKYAEYEGHRAIDLLGDAFSVEMKEKVAKTIREKFGKIDTLIYSLASPKRTMADGTLYHAVIKPVGSQFEGRSIDLVEDSISEIKIDPASDEEIQNTIKVLGGEDWQNWVEFLLKQDLLSEHFKTTFLSYVGSSVTAPIYRTGTLGYAKKDAENRANFINKVLSEKLHGEAIITVNKAIVSKSSMQIPQFTLYMSALAKVQQQKGTYETTTEHQDRAFRDMLFGEKREVDEKRRLRPDAWELEEDTQDKVKKIMAESTQDNLNTTTDYSLIKRTFYALNGL